MEEIEEIEPSEEYVKGFNDGYLLAQDKKPLVAALLKSNSENRSEYLKGIQAGKEQLDLELRLEREEAFRKMKPRELGREDGYDR